MLSRRVFDHYLLVLSEMHRYPIAQPTQDEYFQICAMWLDESQFVEAMRSVAADPSPYWPKPGQIIARVGVVPCDGRTASARLRGDVAKFGADNVEQARLAAYPPVVRQCVRRLGGVAAIEADPAAWHQQFVGVFERLAQSMRAIGGESYSERANLAGAARGGEVRPLGALVGEAAQRAPGSAGKGNGTAETR